MSRSLPPATGFEQLTMLMLSPFSLTIVATVARRSPKY